MPWRLADGRPVACKLCRVEISTPRLWQFGGGGRLYAPICQGCYDTLIQAQEAAAAECRARRGAG